MALRPSVLRVLPLDRQPRVPWRNGGGETREVCAWPPGAGLDDFVWRASVATLERDGPFSRFPGIVRTAVLLDGAGLRLVAGTAVVQLAAPFAQATFDGALPWGCELREGAVQLFNVMVRSDMTARVLASERSLVLPPTRFCVIYAARGRIEVDTGTQSIALGEGDGCAIADAPAVAARVQGSDSCAHFVAACIDPAGRA